MKKLIRIIIGAVWFFAALFINVEGLWNLLLFGVPYLILGYDVVIEAVEHIFKGKFLDENFLMTIATVGALVIGEYPEAVAVMLFYQVGEMFQDYAVEKSKKSVKALMKLRPESARVIRDGKVVQIKPEDVLVGEIITVNQGELIPLDGTIIKGQTFLDTSAVTGEAVPREADVGDNVVSGSINLNGVINVKVLKVYGQSTVSKIIELAENAAEKKTKSEKFITRFAKIYTPAVVLAAVVLAFIPPLFTGFNFSVWVYRALIFLVISCPCALVLSVPMSYFAGIGGASRSGILVKGGNALEILSKAKTFVFDKTGTLTKGAFEVVKIVSSDKDELLQAAATAEKSSSHPISLSIKKAYGKEAENADKINEVFGFGVEAAVGEDVILAGNEKLMKKHSIQYSAAKDAGTVVYVAKNDKFLGYIVISDIVKPESSQALSALKKRGIVKNVILTGDSRSVGESVAKQVGADFVYSELLPEQKVEKIQELLAEKPKNSSLVFVGDGINDAPALACADVGVAMGGIGSDAAVEAADVVIMNDDPKSLSAVVEIAERTQRVVIENISFALGFKALVMILSVFGFANMWLAVIADVGVSALAAINALRCLKKVK